MDLNAFMQSYADEIGGEYSEYDSKTSIIIVPLSDERFQTVLGKLKYSPRFDRLSIEFVSKVCQLEEKMDLRGLLEENSNLIHSRFVISDNYINVEASNFVDSATEEILKEIIQEVANVADEYEFKLTGEDVH
ncbi:YbjN domain-containing protein [Fulvivirga ligni]|uniref:YbjN domain-containing protein n=1 Tax=Fulvivirga ligni TaxID=2904246 RepID=UPI001F220A0F|nr:YbjN domain-containing protein [Fulvivirga ligni]UII20397.1 YbjN domain-containing protein [Fulvivirga ligni]